MMCSTVCQWDNGVIVVDDNVRIAAPYGIEDVTGDEKSVKTVKEWVCVESVFITIAGKWDNKPELTWNVSR